MRENVNRDLLQVVAVVGVAVVAVVAAVVSFEHMRAVAEVAGESWRSWLLPVSVDGMVVAATAAAWSARRSGQSVSGWTALSLAVGLSVSVGANVLAPVLAAGAHLPWLAPVVAAWPPIALALAAEQVAEVAKMSASVTTPAEDVRPAEELSEPEQEPEQEPEELPEQDSAWDEAVSWAKRSLAAGVPVSGYVIGRNYSRTDEWGRSVLESARAAVGSGLQAVA